ncbi:MAG: hypothetical protein WAV05_19355 [Anaerolineales bacterium]
MKFISDIQEAINDPERMESLYQQSMQSGQEAEFRLDLQEIYQKSPDNLLLSAWHLRFEHQPLPKPKRVTNWGLAVILGLITGLLMWVISDPQWIFLDQVPYILLLWSPVATIPALIYLSVISKRNYLHTALVSACLVIISVYILLISPSQSNLPSRDYLVLMVFQLPLLCWIGIGISVMKFNSTTSNRFAFLIKSIEVMITAGLYLIFGIAFGLITLGMFAALDVTPPEIIIRLIAAGGFGLIPLLAVATMYDPHGLPDAQDFSQGLSKFVFTMLRLILPLTLLILVVYIFVIPFNFSAPFQNRNLLIIYNVMQFAIIGLLIGVTPLKLDELSLNLQSWLRRAILAVAILALIISLYALSAVTYRTAIDVITLNRTTIIGWNLINIIILIALVVTQLRKSALSWHERLQNIFSKATTVYLIWSTLLVVLLPLIFK